MNKKQFLALAILLAVPFIFYTIFKTNFLGTDSYYFLSNVCYNTGIDDQYFIVRAFFSILPCNFLVLKALQYFLALIALLAVVQTAESFHKNGWLAGVFIFCSPLFVFEFAKFENELLAIPMLFIANWFFISGVKEKDSWDKFIGIVLVGLTGLFLWQGAIFYYVPYTLMSLQALPFLIMATWNRFHSFIMYFLPNNQVWEDTMGVGFLFMGMFMFTMIGIFLNKMLILPSLFWLVFLLLKAKFAIHALPFLAIATLNLYNSKELNRLDKIYKKPIWKTCKYAFIMCAVMMTFVAGIALAWGQPPTQQQTEIVQEFVWMQQNLDVNTKNDWQYGYWVKFYGGEPTAQGGGIWEQDYNTGIILTNDDLNCSILRQAVEMKLYDCQQNLSNLPYLPQSHK